MTKQHVNFDFLDDVELEEVSGKSTVNQLGKLQRTPEGNCIRLFADGKIYPSEDLVNSFNLEYKDKDAEDQGCGFDIFHAADWAQWPADKPSDIIFIAPVDRSEPKLDVFNSTRHNDDGTPKSSVLDQGSSSFGKNTLLPMLEKVLEEDIFANGEVYVDLEIVTDKPLKVVSNGIYHLPTLITKGKNAGQMSYKRRENLVIYPLRVAVSDDEAGNEQDAPAFSGDLVDQDEPRLNSESTSDLNSEAAADVFNS
tara:strand:- start:4938 stop:5696 length:759 start_codon:yes stop_codon:yes gene_type:complete